MNPHTHTHTHVFNEDFSDMIVEEGKYNDTADYLSKYILCSEERREEGKVCQAASILHLKELLNISNSKFIILKSLSYLLSIGKNGEGGTISSPLRFFLSAA